MMISHSRLLVIIVVLQSILFGESLYIYKENDSEIFNKNKAVRAEKDLNDYYSTKKLGSFLENGKTIFRVFSPNAKNVKLYLFENPSDERAYNIVRMIKDEDGVWETTLNKEAIGIYYCYKVSQKDNEDFKSLPLCVDPYAKAVTSLTDYYNPRKSIVFQDEYDFE